MIPRSAVRVVTVRAVQTRARMLPGAPLKAGLVPMRDAGDPSGETDFEATQDGVVSLAPIRLALTGELDPKLAEALLAGASALRPRA